MKYARGSNKMLTQMAKSHAVAEDASKSHNVDEGSNGTLSLGHVLVTCIGEGGKILK